MAKVQTFVCPEVRLPSKIEAGNRTQAYSNPKKRSLNGESSFSSSSSSSSSRNDKYVELERAAHEKADVRDLYSSIKELSATTYSGLKKKKHKEDILTKLGAPPVKEQTMPFKMKMGILAGRKKRMEKAEQESKLSGVVTANKKSKKSKKRDKKRGDDDDNDAFSMPDFKNGILRIKGP